MMIRNTVRATVLIVCLAIPATVRAEANQKCKIDNSHSSVTFKVLHRGISYVFGRFNEIEGTIFLDNFKKTNELEVQASVEAKSVDTNSRDRDRHLKKDDFFDVREHKEISFKTTASKMVEENKFELTGDLTLLGQSKPITVLFELTGIKQESPGKYVVGGLCTFTIKRSEWGMTYALEGVSDEVTITVSLQALRDVPPAG